MDLCKYNFHVLLSSEFMSVESFIGKMFSFGLYFIILVTVAACRERQEEKRTNIHIYRA